MINHPQSMLNTVTNPPLNLGSFHLQEERSVMYLGHNLLHPYCVNIYDPDARIIMMSGDFIVLPIIPPQWETSQFNSSAPISWLRALTMVICGMWYWQNAISNAQYQRFWFHSAYTTQISPHLSADIHNIRLLAPVVMSHK